MKKCQKLIVRIFLLSFIIVAFIQNVVEAGNTKTLIKIRPSSVTLNTSDKSRVQLHAKVTGRKGKITWKSSKPAVAIVNAKGKVSAKKTGKTIITAKVNGKRAKCSIVVKKDKQKRKIARDVSKLLNMSFNKVRKKLGMDKAIRYEPTGCKEYSADGKSTSTYITNVCLYEYEDSTYPGKFSVYFQDKAYSFANVKLGMTRQKVNKLLKHFAIRKENYRDTDIYFFKTPGRFPWGLYVKYKNKKVVYMMLQQWE